MLKERMSGSMPKMTGAFPGEGQAGAKGYKSGSPAENKHAQQAGTNSGISSGSMQGCVNFVFQPLSVTNVDPKLTHHYIGALVQTALSSYTSGAGINAFGYDSSQKQLPSGKPLLQLTAPDVINTADTSSPSTDVDTSAVATSTGGDTSAITTATTAATASMDHEAILKSLGF